MATSTTTHFRLLDLPKELRLMIYEFLPITTRRHSIVLPDEKEVTLIIKSLPVCLLSTGRFVSEEVRPFMEEKLRYIKNTPPRIICKIVRSRMEETFADSLWSEIWARVEAIEYGSHLMPDLDAKSLYHRLKSREACVNGAWAADLEYVDLDSLARFIQHAGWHLQSNTPRRRLELGLRLEEIGRFELSTEDIAMQLVILYRWVDTSSAFGIPVVPQTLLFRSDFSSEASYDRAVAVVDAVFSDPLVYRFAIREKEEPPILHEDLLQGWTLVGDASITPFIRVRR